MLLRFCNFFCDHLVKAKIIEETNKALYVYGLHQTLVMLINILLTLLIGYLLNMTLQSILFLILYIPIRSYAGGYHASTPMRCYCLSIILVIAVLTVMKTFPLSAFICMAGMILSGIIIFVLAPVQDANKPFTEKERQYFKKKTRLFLLSELLLGVVAVATTLPTLYTCIAMSLTALSVLLILGILKNRRLEKSSKKTDFS